MRNQSLLRHGTADFHHYLAICRQDCVRFMWYCVMRTHRLGRSARGTSGEEGVSVNLRSDESDGKTDQTWRPPIKPVLTRMDLSPFVTDKTPARPRGTQTRAPPSGSYKGCARIPPALEPLHDSGKIWHGTSK